MRQVAIVVRQERQMARLAPVMEALEAVGFGVRHVVFREDVAHRVRAELSGLDVVLVWVDPLTDGADRTVLDGLLREVAAAGALVSAHPDTILAMGTKEVLFRTRSLGWGSDVAMYDNVEMFRREFPERLASSRPRVLKQYRGNGGDGVWKVELSEVGRVRVQHARLREAVAEETTLDEFMRLAEEYFAGGRLIDQAFQPRISEGMVRCYMVMDEVVGFCRQYAPEGPADRVFGLPSAKTMFEAGDPAFASLRRRMECEWVPGLQRELGLDAARLPLLWDADFLFGDEPDAYVLCEINVSCVIPFPEAAPRVLAARLRGR